MKKSALIILTIVASLAMSSCAVQNTQQSLLPPDTMVDVDASDSTHYIYNYPPPVYNYYYSNQFFDSFYRWFFPRRYYAVIQKPGYIPHHIRRDRGTALAHKTRGERSTAQSHRGSTPTSTSKKRGGFGHRGSSHSVVS